MENISEEPGYAVQGRVWWAGSITSLIFYSMGGPLNFFVLGGKICSVEFGRMWNVCLEMLLKVCGTFLQISAGETGIFCRYEKVATGSAAASVMHYTWQVLTRDQSIKFGHSNLVYMPVMP